MNKFPDKRAHIFKDSISCLGKNKEFFIFLPQALFLNDRPLLFFIDVSQALYVVNVKLFVVAQR